MTCHEMKNQFEKASIESNSLFTQEIAKILDHPRVYSFLHVPVQSGSDAVLLDMKREYSSADFRHVANFLKNKYVPRI